MTKKRRNDMLGRVYALLDDACMTLEEVTIEEGNAVADWPENLQSRPAYRRAEDRQAYMEEALEAMGRLRNDIAEILAM